MMVFEYREIAPGRKPRETYDHHCLIIPVQPEPIRVISTQNGVERRLVLQTDDVALLRAGTEASWQWLDAARLILIWIDPTALQNFIQFEMKLLLDDSQLRDRLIITDPDLRSAAERIRQAVEAPGLGSDIVFDSLARVFIVLLVRRYGSNRAPRVQFGSQFRVRDYTRLVDYIEENLDAKITPTKLAEQVGMSEAVFGRKFKLQVGTTPMRFVMALRIEAARQLLTENQLSLSEIAVRCGFADHAHFSRVFKKNEGMSPRTFRERTEKQ